MVNVILIIVLASILFALTASPVASQPATVDARCEVARMILQRQIKDLKRGHWEVDPPSGFDALKPFGLEGLLDQQSWIGGAPPSRALVEILLKTMPSSPMKDCPGFAAEVQKAGGRPPATLAPVIGISKRRPKNEFITVSTPVVSPDGREALAIVSRGCGGLCGSGFLWRLQRKGNEWIVASRLGLWIS